MKSAKGIPLDRDVDIAIRVGPAEMRSVSPTSWQILSPETRSAPVAHDPRHRRDLCRNGHGATLVFNIADARSIRRHTTQSH